MTLLVVEPISIVSHDQNQSISQLPIRTMENMRRNPSTIKIETS